MRKIKEWIYLEQDNILSILKLLIPILLILIIIIQTPKYLRNWRLDRYEIETSAIIESVKFVEGIKESQTGGKLVKKSYEIEYIYRIDSSNYKGKSILMREELNIEERVRISQLSKGDTIDIKVQSKNPNKSIVLIKK